MLTSKFKTVNQLKLHLYLQDYLTSDNFSHPDGEYLFLKNDTIMINVKDFNTVINKEPKDIIMDIMKEDEMFKLITFPKEVLKYTFCPDVGVTAGLVVESTISGKSTKSVKGIVLFVPFCKVTIKDLVGAS